MTRIVKGLIKAVVCFMTVAGIVYAWAAIGTEIMM